MQVTGYGSLFGINFNENTIRDYRSFIKNNTEMTKILFSYMRNNGILLQVKNAGALSTLMTQDQIELLVKNSREIGLKIKENSDE